MSRSNPRRAAGRRIDRRLLGAAGALVVFGGIIGVTQISDAGTGDQDTPKKTVNGLEILTDTCAGSRFEAHDGFQKGERCVSTEFGEVADATRNPSLLITRSPRSVRVGEPFQLKVATRNLVRDRFLAAGKGGYYVESSVLNGDGLVRGHFHTACRMLGSTKEAADPAPVPAFFVATEDGRGSGESDTVTIQVPGMPSEGVAQCASWAGDGSHRVPMMQRANQTPAFDAVRIKVREGRPPASPPTSAPADPPATPPASAPASAPADPPATDPIDPADPSASDPADSPPPAEANQPPTGGEQPTGGDQPAGDDQPAEGDQPAPAEPATENSLVAEPVITGKPTARATTEPARPAPVKRTTRPAAGPTAGDQADADAPQARATTRAAKPSPRRSSASPEVLADADDGAPEVLAGADDGAPDPGQDGDDLRAEPPAPPKPGLALTGTNTMAFVGGGSVLLLIGFVVLSATRRRRPRPARY